MAKQMLTTVVPQNLALEAAVLAAHYSREGCPTIAGHFLALAQTVARASDAAPAATCSFEVGAEWAPEADLAGTHATVAGCLLTMDEDERRTISRWADNVARERNAPRAARLVREWIRHDARSNSIGEPTRVLSAVDDVFYV